jgi:hypothetical protein
MAPDHPDLERVLDEKIAANAQLLRRYGNDILAGHQWFDQSSQKLIPEAALASTGNGSPLEKASANILDEPHRSATRGYYPVDSPDPHPTLPMWMVLLVIGGIALCIGAALITMMR